MTDLRAFARGQVCQVRLPCCNFNRETVVLAHLRLIGISAMGMKAPDLLGAHCCSACHEWCDTHSDTQTKLAFANGVFRTINLLVKLKIIEWEKRRTRGLPKPDPLCVVAPEDLQDDAGPGRNRS